MLYLRFCPRSISVLCSCSDAVRRRTPSPRRRPRVAAPFNHCCRLSRQSRPIWFSPLHSHLTRAELCSHATLAVSHGRRRPRPPRRPAPSPSLSPNRVPQHDHRLPVTLPNPSAPLNRRRQAVAAAQSPAGRPLPVELPPPAFLCLNGARERDPRIPVKLIGPSPPPLAAGVPLPTSPIAAGHWCSWRCRL